MSGQMLTEEGPVGVTWHAVDGSGLALATGRPPDGAGHESPALALARAPVATWPMGTVNGDGRRLRLGAGLGPGGDRVEHLLGALAGGQLAVGPAEVEALARASPAGAVTLPLAVVPEAVAVEASASVEPSFLADVERVREEVRRAVLDAGREPELEAALHVAMLVAVDRLEPAGGTGVDAHVVSGARLWLFTAAVASALSGWAPDAFAPWGWLTAAGYWPVGPSRGRLVVGDVRSGAGAAAP